MSRSNITPRNPEHTMRRGDVVASYGGGFDLVLDVDYSSGALRRVDVRDLESGRVRQHSTRCAASDVATMVRL